LATNRGLPEILSQIRHYISHLPHIGTELPKTWVRVREALENDPRNHISLAEYLDICRHNGFEQAKDSLQLSGYLHDLGCVSTSRPTRYEKDGHPQAGVGRRRFIKCWTIKRLCASWVSSAGPTWDDLARTALCRDAG
jgi:hypothetical protein